MPKGFSTMMRFQPRKRLKPALSRLPEIFRSPAIRSHSARGLGQHVSNRSDGDANPCVGNSGALQLLDAPARCLFFRRLQALLQIQFNRQVRTACGNHINEREIRMHSLRSLAGEPKNSSENPRSNQWRRPIPDVRPVWLKSSPRAAWSIPDNQLRSIPSLLWNQAASCGRDQRVWA